MSYKVAPEELTAHASHLDGVKDRVRTAVSAAEQTQSMSDDAFGLMCSFLPPEIDPMEQRGVEALRAASDGIGTTADNVRATADEYRDSDAEGSRSIGAFLDDGGSANSPAQKEGA